MSVKTIPLYDGQLQAKVVTAFIRLGQPFTLVRPGYDAQGRRRMNWTQIVCDDVPVWEWKIGAEPSFVISKFDENLATHVNGDRALLSAGLEKTKAHRRACFKDGESGEAPAKSITQDPKDFTVYTA